MVFVTKERSNMLTTTITNKIYFSDPGDGGRVMVVVANGRGDGVGWGEDTWYLRIMPTSLVLGKEPEELDL